VYLLYSMKRGFVSGRSLFHSEIDNTEFDVVNSSGSDSGSSVDTSTSEPSPRSVSFSYYRHRGTKMSRILDLPQL
jgi:hypothetical protein